MSIDIIKSKNLLEAIQKDRLEEVEARLSVGEDVNTVFAMNRTGLHCAVAKTNVRMVETLLKAKPDPTVIHMILLVALNDLFASNYYLVV